MFAVANVNACVYILVVTIGEAAKQLSLSPATLRRQISNGRLTAHKVGRDWDINEGEVRRYRAESLGKPGRRSDQPSLGL
jgi:excisionase family DNA binding protein